MKIKIENEQYEIDVNRAIELGICKKVRDILDIRVGDVFVDDCGTRLLIVESAYNSSRYNIAGLYGLDFYGDFDEPQTINEMLDFLNDKGYKFVANINDEISELIEKA